MHRRSRVSVIAILAVAAASCSGGGSQPPVADLPCEPGGSEIAVSADHLLFDADCYAAPADEAFTVTFDNLDEAPHTFSLYQTDDTPISKGPIVKPGETDSEDFAALPRGTYIFRCDVHPAMDGDFVVA
jgi:plastocyanin